MLTECVLYEGHSETQHPGSSHDGPKRSAGRASLLGRRPASEHLARSLEPAPINVDLAEPGHLAGKGAEAVLPPDSAVSARLR
jgi:hypothetical protein